MISRTASRSIAYSWPATSKVTSLAWLASLASTVASIPRAVALAARTGRARWAKAEASSAWMSSILATGSSPTPPKAPRSCSPVSAPSLA